MYVRGISIPWVVSGRLTGRDCHAICRRRLATIYQMGDFGGAVGVPQIVGHIFSWLPKTSSSCWPHYLTSSGQCWPSLQRRRRSGKRKGGGGENCSAGQVLHSRAIVSCETFQLLVIIYSTSKRKLLATVLAPLLRSPLPSPFPRPPLFIV